MAYPTEPPREHPSAYFLEDRSKREDMLRLQIQDKMLHTAMGGALPEFSDPTGLRRVLDVGCGAGGWLIETAKMYPTIERLVGVDVSSTMIDYARSLLQPEGEHVRKQVEFQTMDALRVLQFPRASFDLVNQRFGTSWLRNWEWKKILLEYHRVIRPGGILRITESHLLESTSPALNHLRDIALSAWRNSGRTFLDGSVADELSRLMTPYGMENIQTHMYPLVFRSGTAQGDSFYEDVKYGFSLLLPFFQKWTRVSREYQNIYEQALKEMKQEGFTATWTLVTVHGTKPLYGEPLLMRGLL